MDLVLNGMTELNEQELISADGGLLVETAVVYAVFGGGFAAGVAIAIAWYSKYR